MKAVITGESERVGVNLLDNNDVEHGIEMTFDGEIKYHEQEGYPDKPANRTNDEQECFAQARRYARWYVYRERGYQTVDPNRNPDRLVAVLRALDEYVPSESDDAFDDIREHLVNKSKSTPLELPFDADPISDTVIYQKDIYIQPEQTLYDPPLIDRFIEGLEEEFAEDNLETRLQTDYLDALPDFDLEAISDVYFMQDVASDLETHAQQSPLERPPDATVQLLTHAIDDPLVFYLTVRMNLAFQIRDCYILMGLTPPAPLQVTGFGRYDMMRKDILCDLYDEYYADNATIESWDPGTIQS